MICDFCGEEWELDFLDLWPEEQAFMLDACCEERDGDLFEQLEWATMLEQQERVRFLAPLRDLFASYGIDLRQVWYDEAEMRWRWDFGLRIEPLARPEAKAFVRAHHRHNPPPAGDRYRAGIYNGAELVGVVIVGRPVARQLPQREWVEVNRVCVRDDLPSELTWNACSMAYGWSAREAKRRGFDRIVTYIRADEDGTTLKAAGWTPEHETKAESWHRESRPREQKSDVIQKIRWGRTLRPSSRSTARRAA